MVTGGLESILIGNPSDGHNCPIRIGEGERSAGNGAASFADLLLAAALIDDDTLPSFEAAMKEKKLGSSRILPAFTRLCNGKNIYLLMKDPFSISNCCFRIGI